MAAPIDLSASPSLEAQAYGVILELQKQELAIDLNNRPDNAQITFNTEAQTVTMSLTLDTSLSVSGSTASITVQEYLA